jgi:hypothetical protein
MACPAYGNLGASSSSRPSNRDIAPLEFYIWLPAGDFFQGVAFRTRSHLKLNIEGEQRILPRAMISTQGSPIQEEAFLARNCALAAPL